MWQAQDGLIDTLFALAWGLRTFRVAGILTSPLCWWFGWLLWHLHLACHLARAAKEVYDGPDSKNHHASSMNLDFSSFLRCISTGSMISWTMKVVKCPVLSAHRCLCMLWRWFRPWKEMKPQLKRQLTSDVHMPKDVEHVNRWKGSRFLLLIRLKQVYSLFGPSLVTRPGKCRKFQNESSMNDAQGAWIMMIMVSW